MAKKQLKFDAGQLKDFVDFYELVSQPDGYGGSLPPEWVLRLATRCKKNIKNKTQARTESGSFDFYQVYEFVIRDRPDFTVKKDIIIHSEGALYVIRGYAPLESNPNYILIVTETINDNSHDLFDVINAMPYDSVKPIVINT